ncbi:hypothetical protein [Moraxella lacunata]
MRFHQALLLAHIWLFLGKKFVIGGQAYHIAHLIIFTIVANLCQHQTRN